MNKVSVIIPVRNRPELILRALDSVRSQSFPVHEVIVVDDASTDDTVERVLLRQHDVKNLHMIRNRERRGAPRARNAGAAAATGEFLAFLDSDDVWLLRKTELQLALISSHPECPAVFSDIAYMFGNRSTRRSHNASIVTLADLSRRNVLGTTSTAMIRRTAFEAVGGFRPDLPSCQDWELWLRLAALGNLRVVTEPSIQKYQESRDRISVNIENVLAGHAIVFKLICERINDPAELKITKAEHQIRLGEIYTQDCVNLGRALYHSAKALSLSPTPKRLFQVAWNLGRLARFSTT